MMVLGPSCSRPKSDPARRAEIRPAGPGTIEIVPGPQQLPYCLVFTVSETGIIRQLTMTFEDLSVPCEAGTPIGGVSYRIPKAEGKARVYVIFSDRPLKASALVQQMNELATSPGFSAMDLRAPGQVVTETLEYMPSK